MKTWRFNAVNNYLRHDRQKKYGDTLSYGTCKNT